MKSIVWISPYVPYKNVGHAGGKVQYYYMNYLRNHRLADVIRLISFGTDEEISKCDLSQNGFKTYLYQYNNDRNSKLTRAIRYNCWSSKHNIFHKYANLTSNYWAYCVKKQIKEFYKDGLMIDLFILQWTEVGLLIEDIKKYFPNAKYICIEEDVSFLSYKRKYDYEKSGIKKCIRKIKYNRLKKLELNMIESADLIINSNIKDKKLLLDCGVSEDKLFAWTPFYYDFSDCKHNFNNHIVFYGAMARSENYLSAIWFIEKVMPLLSDLDVVFTVAGGNPHQSLVDLASDRVKILGFVDDVSEVLCNSLCLAAPLVTGGGIKLKIIESMSAGMPVLTNKIGIEGIPAENKKDYLFCETPEDYANSIRELFFNSDYRERISKNSQRFIKESFSYKKSSEEFLKIVSDILEK